MDQNILNNHISQLEEEIKIKQNELQTINSFIEKCKKFIEENKDYAPTNTNDNIAQTIGTIDNLNKVIESNKKDIKNIEASQESLKNVISISSDSVIETLNKEINGIESKNEEINKIINEITLPLNHFMEIKVDCPYCHGSNDQCPLCRGIGTVKLKHLYLSKPNTLYSEKNELAKQQEETQRNEYQSINQPNETTQKKYENEDLYETIDEENNPINLSENDNIDKLTNRKTKFILSRT